MALPIRWMDVWLKAQPIEERQLEKREPYMSTTWHPLSFFVNL